jgi:high affinity Mn2+ porin
MKFSKSIFLRIKYISLLSILISVLVLDCPEPIIAQVSNVQGQGTDTLKGKLWSVHFQETTIGQYHPDFHAPYSGKNSQVATGEPPRISITSTLYIGRKLWKGGALFFNPELSGGRGVGQTLGIAGFPNGETYRIGNPEPVVAPVRIFLRQTFSLGDNTEHPAQKYYESKMEYNNDGQNQISGYVPARRLVITIGKFSITDLFDNNSYSHDPRTQFMNWALMSSGAWDYPADTKGYTWGTAGEIIMPKWSLKGALTMVPLYANGPAFDVNIIKANSISLEYDRNYTLFSKHGVLRVTGFYTNAHMGNYLLATNDTIYHKDITLTRAYGRTKWGFAINAEQGISDNTGIFARLSYNDGKNETWAFTEIDRSFAAGVLIMGMQWQRPADKLGIALVINGISNDHKNYLAAGGYGFIIGDGKINYAYESIAEIFYNFKWKDWLYLSPDYQFVLNPAYNKDRGPIHLFGLRAHVEM